jgi:pyruvate dehydrogenase E1 component
MCLDNTEGPVIAATDYMKLYAEQIRAFVPDKYYVLGTDGYGRSDTRQKLRKFFEIDRYYVATTALKALGDRELITYEQVAEAVKRYGINPDKPNPLSV